MTPDVNVLVAASRADHPHHGVALDWLEDALDRSAAGTVPLCILPMVAAGVIRLVTHPRVFPEPTPPDEAVAFVQAVLETPGTLWRPLGEEWPLFIELCRQHQLHGNAVPDAWIAAAVRHQGEHLTTFDNGFRRLLDPSSLTLLVPESA